MCSFFYKSYVHLGKFHIDKIELRQNKCQIHLKINYIWIGFYKNCPKW